MQNVPAVYCENMACWKWFADQYKGDTLTTSPVMLFYNALKYICLVTLPNLQPLTLYYQPSIPHPSNLNPLSHIPQPSTLYPTFLNPPFLKPQSSILLAAIHATCTDVTYLVFARAVHQYTFVQFEIDNCVPSKSLDHLHDNVGRLVKKHLKETSSTAPLE